MLYRIYTEDVNRSKVESIVAKHFEGFTVIPCTGFWHLEREQTIVIEIAVTIQGRTEGAKAIKEICKEIKEANNQESVMVLAINAEVHFVT